MLTIRHVKENFLYVMTKIQKSKKSQISLFQKEYMIGILWTDYLGRNSSLDLQYHPEVNPQKWRSIATAADKSLILSLTLTLRLTLSLTLKPNLEHNIVVITHFSVAVAILYYFWQLASKRYLQLASAVNAMHPCSCRAHWWVTTEIPMYSRHSTCTSALIELIE